MTRYSIAVVGALLVSASFAAAQSAATGPDLTGRWNRQAGSAEDGSWGAGVRVTQTGSDLTITPASGKSQQIKLDGTESAEVLSASGCSHRTRVTKAATTRNSVTITTWLVTKSACFHGELAEEPSIAGPGPIDIRHVHGSKKIESITTISREGDALIVDETRSNPGQPPSSTSTTYRK